MKLFRRREDRDEFVSAPAKSGVWAVGAGVLVAVAADALAFVALRRHWPGVVLNPGIGFGLLRGSPGLALGLEIGGLVAVTVLARLVEPGRLAAALVVGGGFSNLTIRLLTGHVVDYWHIAGYPYTFNLADLAIRGGVLWFIGAVALSGRRHPTDARTNKKPPGESMAPGGTDEA
jgi:lipoprotein signal peptidase